MHIRTQRGKLVGKLDEHRGILNIKDGNKITYIEIPSSGLKLSYTPGDGVTEKVYIPPKPDKPE